MGAWTINLFIRAWTHLAGAHLHDGDGKKVATRQLFTILHSPFTIPLIGWYYEKKFGGSEILFGRVVIIGVIYGIRYHWIAPIRQDDPF